MVLRTPRRYSHAPPMSLVDYIAELVGQHRSMRWKYKKEPPNYLIDFVDECVGREGVPDLTLKVKTSNCVDKMYKWLSNVWEGIFKIVLGIQRSFTTRNLSNIIDASQAEILGFPENSRMWKLSQLWSMLEYTIFLRRFRVMAVEGSNLPFESLVFDLKDIVSKLVRKSMENSSLRDSKDIVEWFVLQACCYSSLAVFPLLIWYSTIFGTELPPATLSAYTPELEWAGEGADVEWFLRDKASEEDIYGVMSWRTLERYSRMLDFDATIVTAALEIFYGRFLSNPWIRSSVYSSFMRTVTRLASKGEKRGSKKSLTVIPAIYPYSSMHWRAQWIPTPLTSKRLISSRVRDALRDQLQRLTRRFATRRQWEDAAKMIVSAIREEALREESNRASRLRSILQEMSYYWPRSSCVKGVILEVQHPLANYYLFDKIATYNMAYVPGPSIAVNIVYLFLNRLEAADYLETAYYYIVDTEALLNGAKTVYEEGGSIDDRIKRTFERQKHSYSYNDYLINKNIKILSINLERIMKAILLEEYLEKIKGGIVDSCLSTIVDLNKEILSVSRW
ncbi:MAG: hypothetical protein F7C34_03965 [Desulfurococcales archaeon]|nr:hypothetical protein [Desulfurococcales archaeon]